MEREIEHKAEEKVPAKSWRRKETRVAGILPEYQKSRLLLRREKNLSSISVMFLLLP